MTDLHSHILPAIDDGARDCDESLRMIKQAQMQGVDCIVATPHFNYQNVDIDTFIEKRQKAYETLAQYAEKNRIRLPKIFLGAEVYITPELIENPVLTRLCAQCGKKDLLLFEVPHGLTIDWVQKLVELVIPNKTVFPLIAHIERYIKTPWDIEIIERLVDKGIACQMNAEKVLSTNIFTQKIVKELIGRKLIATIASDAHNTSSRGCFLQDAYRKIERDFGYKEAARLAKNARLLLGE